MPNGGSDNCGNCVWNKTEGDRTRPCSCELRGARVTNPFWTYCDNFEEDRLGTGKYRPFVRGPIYSSGIFQGWYTRIPWLGNNEPQTHTSGICRVTGVKFSKGITLAIQETGEVLGFASNDIYCHWLEARLGASGDSQPVIRQSSGDKALHGAYSDLFHQGYLCCDYMHLGMDKHFDFDLPSAANDGDFWKLRDKIRGAIICGAIGDAMGRQVESQDPNGRLPVSWYAPWRGWTSGPTGTITDDTQLTWWLADSLLAKGGLDPDDLARRFTAERIRGIGQATREFVRNYKDKRLPWYQSGIQSSGNGASMRAAPVGIFFRNDFDELKLAAGMQAMVTHSDSMAIASSIVMAYATAKLLRMDLHQIDDLGTMTLFCRDLAESIAGIEDGSGYETRNGGKPATLAQRIGQEIPNYLEVKATPAEVQKAFWSGAYVLESLPFALYCFLYSPGHFDRVLSHAVNESRDADTVAAMAGTLCGALNGLTCNADRRYWLKRKCYCDQDLWPATPLDDSKDYLEELEFREELLCLADRLAVRAWSEGEPS
ncbi:hypothetical protein GEOBRER4_n2780 [Citrifermentans bremense]|uniref:ADP-ribosylglycohydrolase n=1 Tax=Citrifermentans bremense TaxID=60035 RepID=A0A6S6M2M9_9BACT|nr:ADP-ribosylglycohydrolase family protein [Citrifermentans bremense]BCG47928.1 hypothetical protein GEOBRER4_n2780 [Citrifermentans bremense]